MKRTEDIQLFIERFIAQSNGPMIDPDSIMVDTFGDSPEMADQLIALVLSGIKTASCSALWEWEAEKEPLITPGAFALIVDGHGNPRCILETTEVIHQPFNQVDTQFAFDEGEGDRTYEYWRREHWSFFGRTLPKIGKQPAEDMPVVCERFRVIYQETG